MVMVLHQEPARRQNCPLYSTLPCLKVTTELLMLQRSEHQKTLTNGETPRPTPARVSSERTPEEKPGQTWYRSEQDIIFGNGKPSDPAENPVDDKCKERLSFRRKIDAIRTGTSQPGSPEVKAKSIRIVSITRSASSPLLAHKKSATAPNTLGRNLGHGWEAS
ncbi:hypothetical protein OIU79_018112 [Salix purpurea]|uniref:Uncharacterized protein n=1 Tax=Salix purpurea TaxID=77065 RepID=A0A9Q0WXA2_SALPP|nr:hypothetical protein OIU79_018112 [Salix purpurea]